MTSRRVVSDFEISDKFHCLHTRSNAPSDESHRLPQCHLEIQYDEMQRPEKYPKFHLKIRFVLSKVHLLSFLNQIKALNSKTAVSALHPNGTVSRDDVQIASGTEVRRR
jgi:hypothetical protein